MSVTKFHLAFIALSICLLSTSACTANHPNPSQDQNDFAQLPKNTEGLAVATFAGGCFWCTEAVFERVEGVKYVVSGYAGGEIQHPNYKQVSMGQTKHAESIQIYYEADKVSFETLLDVFFHGAHDPTHVNRQGNDVGPQYRSIAFYRTPSEKAQIEKSIAKIEASKEFENAIATQVEPFKVFYPAEQYHQDYYPQHPENRYVQNVTKPKVEKFEKKYSAILKPEYRH